MYRVLSAYRNADAAIRLLPPGECRAYWQDKIDLANRAVVWAQTHTYADLTTCPFLDATHRRYVRLFERTHPLTDAMLNLYPPLKCNEHGMLILRTGACCPSCFVATIGYSEVNPPPSCIVCGFDAATIWQEFHSLPVHTQRLAQNCAF